MRPSKTWTRKTVVLEMEQIVATLKEKTKKGTEEMEYG